MNSIGSDAAHLRFYSAHCSQPLTAPGAAQACPACLPDGSNQRTSACDRHLGRPVEKSSRFALGTSQLGSFISGTASSQTHESHFFHNLDQLKLATRTCETHLPICHFADGVSGFPAHTHRFGQIGTSEKSTSDRVVHLIGFFASLPIQINALRGRPTDCSRPLDFSPLMSVPCCGKQGLRPLAPPLLTGAAHQLTCAESAGACRPIERAIRFAPLPSQFGGFTFIQSELSSAPARSFAHIALVCGHCSGRRAQRVLGPSAIADATNQCSIPEFSGFLRPFSPSSLSPKPQLWTQRKGGFTRRLQRTNPTYPPVLHSLFKPSLVHRTTNASTSIGVSPLPKVIEQSDFPWKSRSRFFASQKNSVLRVSGTLQREPILNNPQIT